MKIIIDARFFGTETGIGRYVKELVENLEKIDLENQYVIFLMVKNFDLYQPKNPNFQKKLADIKWYSWEEQTKMGRIVDAERADLAHFPHFNVPFFCRTPYVTTIHDLILRHFPTSAASTKNPIIFYLKYFFYNLILWRALKRAKKIIAPSYFVRNDIISSFKINPDKIRVIYEGLSNLPQTDLGEAYLKTKNIAASYLLYIGNCYPHKNLEKLVEAFEKISPSSILPLDPPSASPLPLSEPAKRQVLPIYPSRRPDYRGKKGEEGGGLQLVLVGKRDYFSKKLEEKISTTYNLQPTTCIFYGYASDEELATLYKHASLYVFPSLMEGFGLPPLEALSFGLPAAVSDIPVFHEILGGSAFYFNPRDAGDMARIIENVLKNAEVRGKILEEGLGVLNRYNWKKNAAEMLEVYQRLFHEKGGG